MKTLIFIKNFFKFALVAGVLFFGASLTVLAHQPVIEPAEVSNFDNAGLILKSLKLEDPTVASLAVYGNLSNPKNFDAYVFVPSEDSTIPVSLLVPARQKNINFKPQLIVVARDLPNGKTEPEGIPTPLLEGQSYLSFNFPKTPPVFIEKYSVEKLWQGPEVNLQVTKGKNYFILIYEPLGNLGDYSLGLGTKEDFSNVSKLDLLANVVNLKFGLVGDVKVPWLDLAGLFLLIAGLIIGLGAVVVIDFHGLLARKSAYWTETTIRTHKITKPLIWTGLALYILGGVLFFRVSGIGGVAIFQLILLVLLILNGLWLTFYISPKLLQLEKEEKSRELLSKKLQGLITISFLLSFVGWWGNVVLLVWHLLVLR